jgi:hypothetical protein
MDNLAPGSPNYLYMIGQKKPLSYDLINGLLGEAGML